MDDSKSHNVDDPSFLVVDGGGSKLKWMQVSTKTGEIIKSIETSGINPFFFDQDAITNKLRVELSPNLQSTSSITSVYYYGAGCSHAENKKKISGGILDVLPKLKEVQLGTDLLGSARGVCGHKEGIACIIGTGSGACYFDGVDVVKAREGLGWALGDEGSGAHFGKVLLREYLFERMGSEIRAKFIEKFGEITRDEILTNIYRKEGPNQYCAKFAPFFSENIKDEYLRGLVKGCFREFIAISLDGLIEESKKETVLVNVSGSVAVHFKDIFEECLHEFGFKLGLVVQDPSRGLAEYHATQ